MKLMKQLNLSPTAPPGGSIMTFSGPGLNVGLEPAQYHLEGKHSTAQAIKDNSGVH